VAALSTAVLAPASPSAATRVVRAGCDGRAASAVPQIGDDDRVAIELAGCRRRPPSAG
jgi:hypothetical protein